MAPSRPWCTRGAGDERLRRPCADNVARAIFSAHDRSEAKITVVGVPDTPGMAARIFRTVADADINIDMVLQNISRTGETLSLIHI